MNTKRLLVSLVLSLGLLLALGFVSTIINTSMLPSVAARSLAAPADSGLWITRVTPTGGASNPYDRLEIQFSGTVQAGTFTLADVTFTGPGGTIAPIALNPLAADRYELVSSGTGLDTYSLIIGPDIRDLSNQLMEQNHNGVSGEPGDAYRGALFSAGVIITDTQTTYEDQNLILYGNTSTINGSHRFAGVEVLGGATLNHAATTTSQEYRLELSITDTLWITSGAAIDVSGRGYLPGWTIGLTTTGGAVAGGSYGGLGGGATNSVYGDYRNPNELGSGGGSGSGGGLVRITAGSAKIDGSLIANGSGQDGGSGGGILLNIGQLSGSGTIAANGSGGWTSCCWYNGTAGGGGRVAVIYDQASGFNLERQVQAVSGGNNGNGAPGTIYLKQKTGEGKLLIDSFGTPSGAWTPLGIQGDTAFSVDRLVVSGTNVIVAPQHEMPILANNVSIFDNASLTHQAATSSQEYSLRMTISGTLLINSTGKIDVSGRGYLPRHTNGNTTIGGAGADSGGSYGGTGGGITNLVYGSSKDPDELGSGGWAGAGGGLVRITAGSAEIDGALLANGSGQDGGGSGGGILLNIGQLSGSGIIAADGGAGWSGCCWWSSWAGGGGRVAVYTWNNLAFLPTNITANGGAGNVQAGSVWISSTPFFNWAKPAGNFFYGSELLRWDALALAPETISTDLTASSNGNTYSLGTHLAAQGALIWDTTHVPDGVYELHAVFNQAGGTSVGQATRTGLVNNSVVWHSGLLTANETWVADHVHVVVPPLNIAPGVTLTIEAGAIVKFAPGTSLIVEDGAILNAPATASASIILTSLADDTAGGDTNLDGNQTRPVPGEWNGLSVQGTGQANLSAYVTLRYGKAIHSGTLSGNETWQGTFIHEVTGDVIVPSGMTLTIQPGAVVQFDSKWGLTVQPDAQLIAQGTPDRRIAFTSALTAPQPDDHWRNLHIMASAHARLDYCDIGYAGRYDSVGLWLQASDVQVRHCRIHDSSGSGIYLEGASLGFALINNVLMDNQGDGLHVTSGARADLLYTTFARNSANAFYVESGGTAVLTDTIIAAHSTGVNVASGGSVTLTRTLWDNTATPTIGAVSATGNITGAASFAPDGYHLTRYSSAIAQGIDVGVTDDIDGNPRPMPVGSASDLGAVEYQNFPNQEFVAEKAALSPQWLPADPLTSNLYGQLLQRYLIRFYYGSPDPNPANLTVTVTDTLPSELGFDSETHTPAMDVQQQANRITWQTQSPIQKGQSGEIGLTTIYSSPQAGRVFTNQAELSAGAFQFGLQVTSSVPLVAPLIASPGGGEICSGTVEIRGMAQPGVTVTLYVNGTSYASLQPDTSGLFMTTYSYAGSGSATIKARACLNDGRCSVDSEVITLTAPQSFWCPQRSSWEGTPTVGPLAGKHLTYQFRDHTGNFSTQNWIIPGVYGFWNTTLHLRACNCPDGGTPSSVWVIADGVHYDPTGSYPQYDFAITGGAHTVAFWAQCGTNQISSLGQILIDPDGYVFDVTKGFAAPASTVQGVTVTAYVSMPQWGGWVPWPAQLYNNQVNPQVTGSDGYFAFFTPPGSYYLQAEGANGYQAWRSPVIDVLTQVVHMNIPLTPIGIGMPTYAVTLTSGGPSPAIITVPVGSAVQWASELNDLMSPAELVSLIENPVLRLLSARNPLSDTLGFDGGMLTPGQAYRRQFNQPGTFTYSDGVGHTAQVVVTNYHIYLPLTLKNH